MGIWIRGHPRPTRGGGALMGPLNTDPEAIQLARLELLQDRLLTHPELHPGRGKLSLVSQHIRCGPGRARQHAAPPLGSEGPRIQMPMG